MRTVEVFLGSFSLRAAAGPLTGLSCVSDNAGDGFSDRDGGPSSINHGAIFAPAGTWFPLSSCLAAFGSRISSTVPSSCIPLPNNVSGPPPAKEPMTTPGYAWYVESESEGWGSINGGSSPSRFIRGDTRRFSGDRISSSLDGSIV